MGQILFSTALSLVVLMTAVWAGWFMGCSEARNWRRRFFLLAERHEELASMLCDLLLRAKMSADIAPGTQTELLRALLQLAELSDCGRLQEVKDKLRRRIIEAEATASAERLMAQLKKSEDEHGPAA